METAIIKGHRTDNPASPKITKQLGKQRPPTHFRSVRYPQLGGVLAKVRDADDYWAAKACLLFLTFTIARSKQARLATWDEIDFDHSTWTIPGNRMKAGVPHAVPLSSQVIDLLIYVQDRTGSSHGLIFPPRGKQEYILANELVKVLRRAGEPVAVPHGMRSSFRNWAGRNKAVTHDVAEAAMAHSHDKVVAAYLTDDFVEDRIDTMQLWGNFIAEDYGPRSPTRPSCLGHRRQRREF